MIVGQAMTKMPPKPLTMGWMPTGGTWTLSSGLTLGGSQDVTLTGNLVLPDLGTVGNVSEGPTLQFDSDVTATDRRLIGTGGALIFQDLTANGFGIGDVPETQAQGQYLFFIPNKTGAFRSGRIDTNIGLQTDAWDRINIGVASAAFGINTQASGSYSTAFGYVTLASSPYATAFGYLSQATGDFSFATGKRCFASGDGSFAQGESERDTYGAGIRAEGSGSFAQGFCYSKSGDDPSVILASGNGSFAQGRAHNYYSEEIYYPSIEATNSGSFAQGFASSSNSTAKRIRILASGFGSFAQGYAEHNAEILSQGYGSFAHGYASAGDVIASGNNSLAIGDDLNASHALSFLMGDGLSSTQADEMQIGWNSRAAIHLQDNGSASLIGFHQATPIAKPTISGSRGGNVALANLLTALANYGLIIDSTT